MLVPASYWTYRSPPTPELHDLPPGTFKGDERAWHQLSPGMRRTIWQEALRRQEKQACAATPTEAPMPAPIRQVDLTKLSESRLRARIDWLHTLSIANSDEIIAAGRGLQKGSEIRADAARDPEDKLAARWVEIADEQQRCYAERGARMTYHGSMRPIRRRAA